MTPEERATQLYEQFCKLNVRGEASLKDVYDLSLMGIKQAILQERSECAKVAEKKGDLLDEHADIENGVGPGNYTSSGWLAHSIAKAIRERK